MLHRITALLIIGFWLAMTGLLVVRELYPNATQLNAVPISHIGHILFQHEQSSDLVIREKQKEVGHFHIQPRMNRETDERKLEFHGNVGLSIMGAGKQRISWNGSILLDRAYNIERLDVILSTHNPVHQLQLVINPATNIATYDLSLEGTDLEKGSFTMDKKGITTLLERAGIPVGLLRTLLSNQSSGPESELTARQSTLKMNGESISTFVITASAGGQMILEGHITQLGQMLKAQAPLLGYKLLPHNARETD